MEWAWAAVALSTLLLLGALIGGRRQWRNGVHIAQGMPILGVMVPYMKDPVGWLQRERAKYGAVFGMSLAGREIVLLADQGAIGAYYRAPEDVLNAHAAFSDFGFRRKEERPLFTDIPDITRQLVKRKMTNGPRLDSFVRRFSAESAALLKEELAQCSSDNPADVFQVMHGVMSKAYMSAFVGHEVLSSGLYEQIIMSQRLKGRAMRSTFFLPKFMTASTWKKVDVQKKQLSQTLAAVIRDKLTATLKRVLKEQRAKSDGEELPRYGPNESYLDYVVEYHVETEGPESIDMLTPDAVAEFMLAAILGSFNNPAIGSSQALSYLLSHPAVFKKLKQEVDVAFPDTANVSDLGIEQLNALEYLDAVLKEALRLIHHPIGTMRRVVAKEGFQCTLAETGESRVLPCGTFVGIPHILLSTDPKVYANPDAFEPERFLPPRQEHLKAKYTWLPFSGGRHLCPGKDLGTLAMKAIVVQWLKLYPTTHIVADMPPIKRNIHSLAGRMGPVLVTA
eukprot:jgi/Chlat1/3737/Chrsp259S00285